MVHSNIFLFNWKLPFKLSWLCCNLFFFLFHFRNLTAVDMCFHKYLRGCMSIQVAPHANILKSYHAMCNSNPTSSLIRNDQLVNATQCAMATMDNLKSSFQTTNNPFKNMCNEIDKSEKCHRNAGEMPPMFSYMAMAGNRTVEEFKHKFCDNSMYPICYFFNIITKFLCLFEG